MSFVYRALVSLYGSLQAVWGQHRQFAYLFPFGRTAKVGRMIGHPKFRNNFADQVPVTKKPNHRALRNDDAHGLGHRAHVGGGNVTATEPEWHLHLSGYASR